MKATAQPLTASVPAEKSWVAVYADLFKARLTFLVLLHTLLGTSLVAAGASALNQLLEREHDAKMRRTQNRPLPSGRLQPQTVLLIGGVASMAGLIYLAAA